MKKKIVITGNSGLLGRAVISRFSTEPDFEPIPFNTAENPRSITNETDCIHATENGVWAIINLASKLRYTGCNRATMNAVNTIGAKNMLKAGLDAGVKIFIQASTQEVYDLDDLPSAGFSEDSHLNPQSDYSFSKLEAEKQLMRLSDSGLIIFRMCVIFGDRPSPQSLLDDMLHCVKHREPIAVWGKGKRLYDILSAWDISEVFVQALRKRLEGIYNLGAGQIITVKDIAEAFHRLTGSEIQYLSKRPEKQGYYLNTSKLSSQIEFYPTDLEIGLKRMLSSLLEDNICIKEKLF